MQHKKLSVMLLTAGSIALLGGAFLFFFYAPAAGNGLREAYPELAYLFWPLLTYLWLIAAAYLVAMVEYMRISLRIGQNRSFCHENVNGLHRISLLMLLAGCLWVLLLPLFALIAVDIGPSFILFLLAALASLAVGLLAYALSALLRHAVELQEDSDLTV